MTKEQEKIKQQGEKIKEILEKKDKNGLLRNKLIQDIISHDRQEVLNDLLLILKEVDYSLVIIEYILENEKWENEAIIFANALR